MNENFTNTELLIQYLDGELTGQGLADMEQKLATDKILREELENLRVARDAVKSFGLRNHIRAIHKEMKPGLAQENKKPGVVRSLVRNSMKVAATVIILFLMIGIYQYATLSPGKVFTDNYSPYQLRESRSTEASSSLETAFKRNQFPEVIDLFQQLKQPTISEYFLAGHAYLHENKPNEAIRCFSTVLQIDQRSGTDDLKDDAEYYLAMSYLKNKQVDKALPIFEKIHTDTDHLYHDKVSKWFLRKLHWMRA